MASRGRKVAIVLAMLAAALIAVLAVGLQGRLGDAWNALLGRSGHDDVLTLPGANLGQVSIASGEIEVTEFAKFLSSWVRIEVVLPSKYAQSPPPMIYVATDMWNVTPEVVIALLRENGWHLRRTELPSGREMYTLEPAKR